MARDDDTVCVKIKTPITLLGRRVTEEDTLRSEETIYGESWH